MNKHVKQFLNGLIALAIVGAILAVFVGIAYLSLRLTSDQFIIVSGILVGLFVFVIGTDFKFIK